MEKEKAQGIKELLSRIQYTENQIEACKRSLTLFDVSGVSSPSIKMDRLERNPDAMPSPRGYTIDLYCCRLGCNSTGEAVADGYYAYSLARKIAKAKGWILHNDGYATCPVCAEKLKGNQNHKL